MVINAFKNNLFPLASGNYYQEIREESSESSLSTPENRSPTSESTLGRQIFALVKFSESDKEDFSAT